MEAIEKQNTDIFDITFLDWTFSNNNSRTESLYKSILCGKSAMSNDLVVQKYASKIKKFIPASVINLFYYLNIEPQKDAKIYTYKNEDGNDVIEATYFFVGEITAGKSCQFHLVDDIDVFELYPVNENFSIGFFVDEKHSFNEKIVWVEICICLDETSSEIRY